MKVYILHAYEETVTYGGYEGLEPRLLGVYSTIEKAEQAKKDIKPLWFCGDIEDVTEREIKEVEVE